MHHNYKRPQVGLSVAKPDMNQIDVGFHCIQPTYELNPTFGSTVSETTNPKP
jgi:hypothetical protein